MRDWRAELRDRLRGANLDPTEEADVVDELGQHLEDRFAELSGRVGIEAAERRLVAELDGPDFRASALRRRRRAAIPADPIGTQTVSGRLESLWQDVRYGARSLRRSPAFTVVAALSLALGIGATTAIFGLLNAVVLERLAVRDPQELIQLQRSTGGKKQFDRFGYSEYLALKEAPGLPRVEATASGGVTVLAAGQPNYPQVDVVSGGFFDMLGTRPIVGRAITVGDERSSSPVVVISEAFWEQHLGRDTVVGRTLRINDHPFTIVGILPRSYRGVMFGGSFTLAVPMSVAPLVGLTDPRADRGTLVTIIARLPRGQTIEQGARAIDVVYQGCCGVIPVPGPGKKGAGGDGARAHIIGVDASRGTVSPKYDLRGEYQRILVVLMSGVVVLLLIVCANVGSLLSARATSRQRELAVRVSMGATRGRIARQLITESLELAVLGAIPGLVLAQAGTALLAHNLPPNATNLADAILLRPNLTILGFAAAVTIACTLLFGGLPALQAIRGDVMTPLKSGVRAAGRGRSIVDRAIVATQVALALVLVCAAALFATTLRNLKRAGVGVEVPRLALAVIDSRGTTYTSRSITTFSPDLLDRVRRISGVTNVALSTTAPVFGGNTEQDFIRVPGFEPTDDADFSAQFAAVGPQFFAANGIGIHRGRTFDSRDVAGAPSVAIVSEAFAKHFFPRRDPLGSTIILGQGAQATTMQIVGIVGDAHYQDLRGPATEIYYGPIAQAGDQDRVVLSVATAGDPAALAVPMLRVIEAVAPGIRIRRITALEDALNDALARERLAAALATLFGLLALGLAAVGLYGVVAYNVSRRTQEIGVRMALGARSTDVLWMVVRQTLAITVVGVAVGILPAMGAARAIGAQLYGIGANDPRVMIGAALVLVLVGIAASAVPGRRAARVDPVTALKSE